jgi:hypothetical protein
MIIADELKQVSDDEILRRLSEQLRQSRRVEAVLVAHIAEVDDRRLYIREAPSMFAYCTQVLRLSEHEAYARIAVARAARRYPELLLMLSDGRLHLSGIAKLAPHLTDANRETLLARATHRTKSEIEQLIAEIAPKPDVPAAMRKVPERIDPVPRRELGLDRVAEPTAAIPAPAPCQTGVLAAPLVTAPPVAALIPLSPARYKVQFTATAELRDKLERLQALIDGDLAAAIEAAVTEKLERLESKRFGLTKAPRKTLDATDTSSCSRYLPVAVRRIVRNRDGEQCTFVLRNGGRCPERRRLEFHHRDAFGRGGTHDPENVCLMCRQHNAYLAELEYGKARVEKYRRSRDRVCEGTPRYVAGSNQRLENLRHNAGAASGASHA